MLKPKIIRQIITGIIALNLESKVNKESKFDEPEKIMTTAHDIMEFISRLTAEELLAIRIEYTVPGKGSG